MPDQPQSPNSNRISAMLQDLSTQRGQQGAPAPVGGPAPTNLPVAPLTPRPAVPATPAPVAPTPIVPPAPRPVVAPPAGAIPPARPATPPAPRELPVMPPARAATPPPPPPPPAPAAPKLVIPVTPPAPAQPPLTSELRTMAGDIGQIQVGRPTSGVRPVAPVAPVVPPPAPVAVAPARPVAPQVVVIPSDTGSGKGMKLLVFGIGGLLVLGILAYVISMFTGGSDVALETPTPSATVAPTLIPQVKKLSSYFATPAVVLDAPADISAFDLFVKIDATTQPQGGLAIPVTVMTGGNPLTATDILKIIDTDFGSSLQPLAGSDQMLLSYGQKEHFDSTGAPDATAPVSPSSIFIVEVVDASAANQFITEKAETNVREGCTGFNSGTYREVPIRYRNCPFADNAEDFAIVLASNNKNYFVSSNSRESMFFAINQLMQ